MFVIATAVVAVVVGIVASILIAALWGEAVARRSIIIPLVGGTVFGLSAGLLMDNGWVPVGVGPTFSILGWLIYRSFIATR